MFVKEKFKKILLIKLIIWQDLFIKTSKKCVYNFEHNCCIFFFFCYATRENSLRTCAFLTSFFYILNILFNLLCFIELFWVGYWVFWPSCCWCLSFATAQNSIIANSIGVLAKCVCVCVGCVLGVWQIESFKVKLLYYLRPFLCSFFLLLIIVFILLLWNYWQNFGSRQSSPSTK